ncbi:hypothetical protein EJ05DRAFT_452890 [Pseudovirgaria hyperparasitica]|uniref:Vps41 beta-propeller domain-containing protein n=1 Tax=Pseudovirgaria hyperparasitica TaxID=470096 RepID=A0A6A6W6G9_9PEZI|nr:uncharacterized protein EJ05DRAFT_452890 [Pseudovirgaria hyperparasitica]KAF2758213.1 hypothetical protein EJ05DRAFT_452890 [Pseudovirgaria hyperparasitica]
MAAESTERDEETAPTTPTRKARRTDQAEPSTPENGRHTEEELEESEEEEEDEEEGEPTLKYTPVTGSLGSVYRGGDATSATIVGGDKMIMGTHNGKVHVRSLPTFQPLRSYGAHQASITSVSISPLAPHFPTVQGLLEAGNATESPRVPSRAPTSASGSQASPQKPRQAPVPSIPSNQIYIGTSSIDGTVCVMSLVDEKDYTLRNFARPVQAVALSPDYKSDRTYLSGGLAGNLILTSGGPTGYKADANTNSAAAAASGWLGSIGLGGNTGKDVILHSGEGAISTIQWSLSGKFVVWANEEGMRIMRTNLHLESADSDYAWKRVAFIPKPNRKAWRDMAGVWKARAQWIDEKHLELDDGSSPAANGTSNTESKDDVTSLLGLTRAPKTKTKKKKRSERLVVGWGDAAWIISVTAGSTSVGKDGGDRKVGSADIMQILSFQDCIVAGLTLYTPSLLAVLAYRTRDDDDNPLPVTIKGTPKRGVQHRQNGLQPELRLLDVSHGQEVEEVEVDTLNARNFESLSAADYHLSSLYVPVPKPLTAAQRSALESIGGGIWDVGVKGARLFSTGASIISIPGSGDNVRSSTSVGSGPNSNYALPQKRIDYPAAATPGLKIFFQSPYDCVLAVKRDFGDRLDWDLEHENYKEAWELLEKHPEIISNTPDRSFEPNSPTSTPSQTQGSLQEFFADDSASQTTTSLAKTQNSAAEKEKRRIGDLWVQQLVTSQRWSEAGKVAGRVLGHSGKWEHWVLKFCQSGHYDDITPYVPVHPIRPPIPSYAYELILGHYIVHDKSRLKELLDTWDVDLFDLPSVISSIKNRLQAGDVTEESIEDGEQGRDWRILQEMLAKLYLADNRPRDALHCYIRVQDADAVMGLLKENHHLLDAIRDDIPGFILLRVTKEQMKSAPRDELEEISSEAIRLLVDEAYQGTVSPEDVVSQLKKGGMKHQLFLYFYLQAIWKGQGTMRDFGDDRQNMTEEGKGLIEDFSDLAVNLFAEYNRPLLMEFLKASHSYDFTKALRICEQRKYVPERIHLLSKMGQTKDALRLIISELGDVSLAISFVKEQDDTDLWDDLLTYSMDKPRFIRALLEEVGTAIDPIKLIRRIPEGLEIEGLREGIGRMIREYGVQHSISEGVSKVLRGEVSIAMETLRSGQKRGVRFEVAHKNPPEVEITVQPAPVAEPVEEAYLAMNIAGAPKQELEDEEDYKPGACVGCRDIFLENETDTLIGFACGHVYHLTCLLDQLPGSSATAEAAQAMQQRLAASVDADDISFSSRSVGAKVAHAHIIRSVVREGCPVCKGKAST